MSQWGLKYLPASEELGIRAHLLKVGGPKLWDEFMDELREIHLGIRPRSGRRRSVTAEMEAAYQAVVARKRKR
jgi:hypothetical protein